MTHFALGEELVLSEKRHMWIGPNSEKAIFFCAEHWMASAIDAIEKRGLFAVALSGGSTPGKIFAELKKHPDRDRIDYRRLFVFWSDERSVPPTSSDSNYKNAMESGIADLGIAESQIFRMEAESDIQENAKRYQELIESHVPGGIFDLVMLGVGEDGHTASLFPNTKALTVSNRLVAANEVPQKKTWRMTMTYPCINAARQTAIYALGERKGPIIEEIFKQKKSYPVCQVGTKANPALWVLDRAAASLILP